MNEILVYVKAEAGKKYFIGTFTDFFSIESDVLIALQQKKLTQYKNKVFMVYGTETFQMKF